MSENKHNGVEINTDNVKVEMKWENLTDIYTETTSLIGTFGKMLGNIDITYGELIKTNDDVTKEYLGSVKLINEFTLELLNILSSHSTIVKKDGKEVYSPFKGLVNGKDENSIESYINIVVAYEAFSDRLQKVMEQTGSHLLGKINALQAEVKENGK